MMAERKCTLPLLLPHGRVWKRQMSQRGTVRNNEDFEFMPFPSNGYVEQELRPEVRKALEAAT